MLAIASATTLQVARGAYEALSSLMGPESAVDQLLGRKSKPESTSGELPNGIYFNLGLTCHVEWQARYLVNK